MHPKLFDGRFIFGSQYYRAPSPACGEWQRDLKQMADLGFNTVKYWIQWRWNHPEPERFYFDDIDELMDLAQESGLSVMLNTIVDVAPAWIYREYPDASMITLDGRAIGPQTQPHRQIGGLGVCLNHPEVMEHLFRFLEACIERYSDHPALSIWNVGSEPELTQSMSELRLYASDASRMGDMLCYCDRCRARFKLWLKSRYDTIEALNVSWNRNYRDFDDVELPLTRNTFNDMVDWRMFFVHTLGENVRRRFRVAARIDRGRHPLMCHHVFVQGFPVTSTANDPWNVGQTGDLHGFTQMDDPMMHDILRCCARGKPVISAEMLMLMGYTLDLHPEITERDIKRHIFTGVAANIKGFIFWQYRPETLGREAPAWGLSHLDGSTTPWLESFAEIGRVLQKDSNFLHRAQPRKAEIAILYSPENNIFAWASTGNEKSAIDAMLGVHRALYEASYLVDFVHPAEFSTDILSEYRVLVLPFPYWLRPDVAARIRAWVDRGGLVIAEAYIAGWNTEEGRHETTVPGAGLRDVFGIRQRNVAPVGGDSLETVKLIQDTGSLLAGTAAQGAMVKETFFVENADVLATYDDGEAAITASRFGKGMAIALGSYLAVPYARGLAAANGSFLSALVDQFGNVDRPDVRGDLRVRVDTLLSEDGGKMLVAQNLDSTAGEAGVTLTESSNVVWSEVFTGETVLQAEGRLELQLEANEVKVFRA